MKKNLRRLIATNNHWLLLEAWADGYVSRMTSEGMAPLREMTGRGLLLEATPFCWVLTGSGVHLVWSLIRYFQSSGVLRSKHPALVRKFEFLAAVPDARKENMGA